MYQVKITGKTSGTVKYLKNAIDYKPFTFETHEDAMKAAKNLLLTRQTQSAWRRPGENEKVKIEVVEM